MEIFTPDFSVDRSDIMPEEKKTPKTWQAAEQEDFS
tara:strand:- start:6032 stop:6139 length:108 start_codon:yes stop_codon:yes gene_type:complete